MDWFSGDEHEPFHFPADPDTPRSQRAGALLVHGFMGSPREMRPIGHALAKHGIDATAPLLPGFGPNVADLDTTRATDWVRAAERAWDDVIATNERTILIGFSMGAAIALQTALRYRPDRLILLAPLSRLVDFPLSLAMPLLPVLKHVIREFSPFARANFDDPKLREYFREMDPTLDLDDASTQRHIRDQTSISMGVIDQLRRVTVDGVAAGEELTLPSLIIQGDDDDVVTKDRTSWLIERLGGPVSYLDVPCDHLVVRDDRPCWPMVRDRILEYVMEPRSHITETVAMGERSRD